MHIFSCLAMFQETLAWQIDRIYKCLPTFSNIAQKLKSNISASSALSFLDLARASASNWSSFSSSMSPFFSPSSSSLTLQPRVFSPAVFCGFRGFLRGFFAGFLAAFLAGFLAGFFGGYCSENPFQKQFNTCSGRGCWDQV